MSKIETLRKKLAKCEGDIEILRRERHYLTKQIQEVCDHPRAMKNGGEMWHDWPDYGREPYIVSCTECGVEASSQRSEDSELYAKLNERVIKDYSQHD